MVKNDCSESHVASAHELEHAQSLALTIHKSCDSFPICKDDREQTSTDFTLPADFLNNRGTVFAVLDAGCLESLPVLIDIDNIPHRNLFSGALAETGKNVAPYLVELSADSTLLRNLLSCTKEARMRAGAFWDAQAGIFLSTAMTLDQLRSHLRRFLRVISPPDTAYFFRFWQPEVAETYFSNAAHSRHKTARWFFPHDMTTQIDAIWAPVRNSARDAYLIQFSPNPEVTRADLPGGQFQLDPSDTDALHRLQWKRDVAKVRDKLCQAFPQQADNLDIPLTAFCDTQMRRAAALGFAHLDQQYIFCAWELNLGPSFENLDETGKITKLMQSREPAEWRFERIKARMTALEEAMA
jgi:hypothetical protein